MTWPPSDCRRCGRCLRTTGRPCERSGRHNNQGELSECHGRRPAQPPKRRSSPCIFILAVTMVSFDRFWLSLSSAVVVQSAKQVSDFRRKSFFNQWGIHFLKMPPDGSPDASTYSSLGIVTKDAPMRDRFSVWRIGIVSHVAEMKMGRFCSDRDRINPSFFYSHYRHIPGLVPGSVSPTASQQG